MSEALACYTAAVEAGAAPPPLPLYVEQQAAAAPAGAAGAFDVAFELLRLHAVVSEPGAAGSSPAALAPLLARLLRLATGAISPPLCTSPGTAGRKAGAGAGAGLLGLLSMQGPVAA